MYLNTNITVSINNIPMDYVVAIKGTNSSEHIGSNCDLQVPLMAITAYNSKATGQGKKTLNLTSQVQSNSGYPMSPAVNSRGSKFANIETTIIRGLRYI